MFSWKTAFVQWCSQRQNLKAKIKAKASTLKAKVKAKAKAIKFGLEAPRGQGLASRTTSLLMCYFIHVEIRHFRQILNTRLERKTT